MSYPISENLRYSFGWNNTLVLDWIRKKYKTVKIFDSNIEIKKRKNLQFSCEFDGEKETEYYDLQTFANNDKKIKEFKKWLRTEDQFVFTLTMLNPSCDEEDPGVNNVTCIWNWVDKRVDIVNPKIGYQFGRWDFVGIDEMMQDQIYNNFNRRIVFNLVTVPLAFQYKYKFQGVSEANFVWNLVWMNTVFKNPTLKAGEIMDKSVATQKKTIDSLVYGFKELVDEFDEKCNKGFVFDTEINKCITEKDAEEFLEIPDMSRVDPYIHTGLSVQKFDKKMVEYINKSAALVAYFLLKYPLATSVIPDLDEDVYPFISWQTKNENEMHVPAVIVKGLREFLANPKKRFFIIKLGLKKFEKGKPEPGGHANTLIYDKLDHTLVRWEPHAGENIIVGYNLDLLDHELNNFVENLKAKGKLPPQAKYQSPEDFCPIGRVFQLDDKGKLIYDNPVGKCKIWAWWYVDTILKNPKYSREEILDYASNQFKVVSGTKFFIERYQKYLESETAKVTDLTQEEFLKKLAEHDKKLKNQFPVYVMPEKKPEEVIAVSNRKNDKNKKFRLTTAQCRSWKHDRNFNPLTGRKIKHGSRTYEKIRDACKGK